MILWPNECDIGCETVHICNKYKYTNYINVKLLKNGCRRGKYNTFFK
jgi:hypothetical protein